MLRIALKTAKKCTKNAHAELLCYVAVAIVVFLNSLSVNSHRNNPSYFYISHDDRITKKSLRPLTTIG